ncbi:MAG: polyprenyl synthetase [Bacteroidetes bacterium]|nr:MAG: polyprenyl synthetase [Bacteroidota bacterium]
MAKLSDIQAPIRGDLQAFNAYFESVLHAPSRTMQYALRYVLRRRGKQLRPMLVYLSAGICGGIREETSVAAAMVEMVHSASLIHDDVVDQADMRRGLPSLYRIWKAKGAVLTGDYMLAQGLRLAVESGQYELLGFINAAVQQMSIGELEQLRRARKLRVDEVGYYDVIRGKTAALLAVCTQSGAHSAGASPEQVERMRQLGEYIGMAFQIRDDILDFAEHPGIGKSSGNDLKEGKMTLPIIYALEGVDPKERRGYERLLLRARKDAKARSEALTFVRQSEGIARSEEKVREFTQMAVALLDDFPPSAYADSLRALAEYLVQRKK